MTGRSKLLLGATLLAALTIPASPAAAGGGCHGDVTTGTGDTVEMVEACFTPTTLRIDPGDTVTFVNRDPMIHNVGANGWGNLEDMSEGEMFTATFAEPGIFPYACSYHPGMTGAVVVGGGTGAGNGAEVAVAFHAPAPTARGDVAADSGAADGSESAPIGWIATGAAGLVLGLGAGRFARRRSNDDATSS